MRFRRKMVGASHRTMPRYCPLRIAITLGMLAAASRLARADENFFGYTYGSETLPAGRSEVYQWATWRTGKADGRFNATDLQTELEHGFTDRLQASVYLNAAGYDVAKVTGLADQRFLAFNGLQGSLKYALTSPYKDRLGLAVYLEPGFKRFEAGSGERTDTGLLETKLIAQKNLLDGLLVWAGNLTAEFEREHHRTSDEWESELELELSTGVSYRFAPRWFAGAEAVANSAFERMHLDELGEYAVFAGPNLHYANDRWWFTVTLLAQVTGWPESSGHLELDHYEKLQLRTKVGVNF